MDITHKVRSTAPTRQSHSAATNDQLLFESRSIQHTPRNAHSSGKHITSRTTETTSAKNLAHGHVITASSTTVTKNQVLLASPGVTTMLARLQPIPTMTSTAGDDPALELAVVQ